ncbi:MAG: NAD(P)/FAD-dependent oxidoreductase [Hydrogenovibrio sp.]
MTTHTRQLDTPPPNSRIAVIGSGISGLASAWLLSQKHDVTLLEKNDYLGGHTHTVNLDTGEGKPVAVDTGFIVYNEPNYPLLTEMLRYLKIDTLKTEMSFAVSINQGEVEYSGDNLNTLFAQRRNLFSPTHWQMLTDIVRFNRLAKQTLAAAKASVIPQDYSLTLEDFLAQHGFSDVLIHHYLLPMAAAIWSCPTDTMLKFPAHSFLQFFENHGLLNIDDRPQWQTIHNGSNRYIEAIFEDAQRHKRLSAFTEAPVENITREADGYAIDTPQGRFDGFDHIVFASHADESYALLPDEFKDQFAPLRAFQYQKNTAYLHGDRQLMPKRRLTWAAWNYLRDKNVAENRVAVTYWMNKLQSLPTEQNVFVTLNPIEPPAQTLTHAIFEYDHPVFDSAAMQAQGQLDKLQGLHNLWFAGAYTGYGFHEDGLRSAVNLAERFGLTPPWTPNVETAKIDRDIQPEVRHA